MATEAQKQEVVDKVTKLVTDRFGGDFQKAFEHYDSDPRDGRINKAELGAFLKEAGIGNWLTRGAWTEGILSALDADKDGTISAEEFLAVLKS
jgi:Ca2+-binding EF-hand superfamily protein